MDKIGDNIILIGMPTSGKSTVGVVLAKILDVIETHPDTVFLRKIC